MIFKVKDHYFKKAKKENFLARSIYKLEEIDKKYQVLKAGTRVLDLGYYPGSWTQYVLKMIKSGSVVGIDIQGPSKQLANENRLKMLNISISDVHSIEDLGETEKFDTVLSDMAPSTTGVRSVDQDRSLNLVEEIFRVSEFLLVKGGTLVFKAFASNNMDVFIREQKGLFESVNFLRPKSTRSVSKEYFVILKGYKGV